MQFTPSLPEIATTTIDDALRKALDLHAAGRIPEAEKIYRAILQAQPNHPDANHNLGLIVRQAGHVEASIPLFRTAVAAYPQHDQFWVSYVESLIASGRLKLARQGLADADKAGLKCGRFAELAQDIDEVESRTPSRSEMEALVEAFDAGRHQEVESMARAMVEHYPHHAFGWKALGSVLNQIRKYQEAEAPLRKAIELNEGDGEAFSNLGYALFHLGRLEDSEAACRKAIALTPDLAEAYNNLSLSLHAANRMEEMEAVCRKAVELNPRHAKAFNNLSIALYNQGKHREALEAAEKALSLNPGLAIAYTNLASIYNELGRSSESEAAYRKAITLDPVSAESYRMLSRVIRFGKDDPLIPQMLKLYEEPGIPDDERLHLCFALGKAFEDLKQFDRAFGYYAEANALTKKKLGYRIDQDAELFGSIRSAFQTGFATEPVSTEGVAPILIVGMPRSGTSLVEQILSSHSLVHGAGELELLSMSVQKHFLEGDKADPAAASRIVAGEYFAELRQLAAGKPFCTDKMPMNFRFLGFLLSACPDLKVVHTMRDPMAVCWSIYSRYFPAEGMSYSYDLSDLAAYYRMYRDLMAFWREMFPGRIYDLEYEELTENQEEETRKLLSYCGLPWEEACLSFEKTQRAVKTASAAQVRQKMYRGSSDAWKKFETHLAPLKDALGAP